jgi:sugar-specific transcriptional regulator TrmB
MENKLRELGLGYYESLALIALFKERLALRELSKKARIPFGKIYSVVKGLKEKNLVSETDSRPKLIYVDNASEVISRLLEEKKKKDSELIEKLQGFATEIDRSRDKETRFFHLGTTVEENKSIQSRSFDEAKNEVLQILNIYHKPDSNRESKNLWEKSIRDAVKRGVKFKAIYPKNVNLPKAIEKLNLEHPQAFQIRKLDTDFVRCDIIDENKVLIKLVQRDPLLFGGIIFVENEKLNTNLRKIFYELWNNASSD